jgi:hypothetical protein
MASLSTDDVPGTGCRHIVRDAVVQAVSDFFTTVPTVAERTITRTVALKTRIATAAGLAGPNDVSNKMMARALQAAIEERFGGTE